MSSIPNPDSRESPKVGTKKGGGPPPPFARVRPSADLGMGKSALTPVESDQDIEAKLEALKELIKPEVPDVPTSDDRGKAFAVERRPANDQKDIEEARGQLEAVGVEGTKNDVGDQSDEKPDKPKIITLLHVGNKKPLQRNFEPIDEERIAREVSERRAREQKRREHLEAMDGELARVARAHAERFKDELTAQKVDGTLNKEVVKKIFLRSSHDEVVDVATFGFVNEEQGLKYETRFQTPRRIKKVDFGYSLPLEKAGTEISPHNDGGSETAHVAVDFSESSGLPVKVEMETLSAQETSDGFIRTDRYVKSGGILERILKLTANHKIRERNVMVHDGNFSTDLSKRTYRTQRAQVVMMNRPKFNFSYDPSNAEAPLQLTLTDAEPKGQEPFGHIPEPDSRRDPVTFVSRYDAENDVVTFDAPTPPDNPLISLSGKEFVGIFDEVLSVIPDNPYERGTKPTEAI